jgi:Protein of unknown function (DUF3352)
VRRIADAARRLRYGIQDIGSLIGRAPRAVVRGARRFWSAMAVRTRQRLVLAVGGGVAAALVLFLAIPALPCAFPGGEACAPDDDAEQIVPADSLAYVHVTVDPEDDQYAAARRLAGDMPLLARQIIGPALSQLPGPEGGLTPFEERVTPWLGDEVAVALLPGPGPGEQVYLLEASDSDGATEYAESIAAGTAAPEEYEGVELRVDERGQAWAQLGGFLALGREDGVRRLIEVETGAEDASPLSDDETAERLRDELPTERFADAYVSRDGIGELVAGERAAFSWLEPFVGPRGSEGFGAALAADDGSLEISLRSSLDPGRSETAPSLFAALPQFNPGLIEELPADTLAYAGIGDPGQALGELISLAGAQAPSLAKGLAGLLSSVRRLGDVDVAKEVLPALGGEGAFAVQPGPGGQELQSPPFLEFLADGVDEQRARNGLARLQGPVASALDPGIGPQAPSFDRRQIEGVEAYGVRVSPALDLTYALVDGRLVIATQPAGVEQLVAGEGGLAGSERFEHASEGFPDQLSLLAYLDLAGLLTLAERAGLAEDPAYATFASEIRRLDTLGVAVEAGDDTLAMDLRLTLGEEREAPVEGAGD